MIRFIFTSLDPHRIEDHGSWTTFFNKRKEKCMLLDLVRVQAEGEEMEIASRRREEAVQGLKEILGENYLLHPSNMVGRLDRVFSDEYVEHY